MATKKGITPFVAMFDEGIGAVREAAYESSGSARRGSERANESGSGCNLFEDRRRSIWKMLDPYLQMQQNL
jgi:hypothetical protein